METRYCAIVWAIKGAGEVPKKEKPRIETNFLRPSLVAGGACEGTSDRPSEIEVKGQGLTLPG